MTDYPYFGSDPQGFQSHEELDAFLAMVRAEIERLDAEKRHRVSKKGGEVSQMVMEI